MNEQSTLQAQPAPVPATPRPRWLGLWFGWWVAGCLCLLAFSSYQQLQIQQRILARSQALKDAVAEAAEVSAATVQQLDGVAKLDAATTRVASQLSRIAAVNGQLRAELAAMEPAVRGIDSSIATLDKQTQESAALLAEIAAKSDALQGALTQSLATGRKVSSLLSDMSRLQGEVTANLGVMVGKTGLLDRFAKE